MPHFVHITARAIADVDAVVSWIAQRAPQTAANWQARLLAKLQTLQNNAKSCPLADEAAELGIELREMLFGKRSGVYRILFTIDGSKMNVVHIRHTARDRLKLEDVQLEPVKVQVAHT